nr:caspase family protein [Candidatus Neomarinimicrobiota bacterium]
MHKLFPILLFAYGLSVTTEDIYDNSYALIIGIDKYQNVQPLNYAVKDAESIQDILVNTFDFPEDNVTLLKNEEATKQNILKSFSEITKKAEDSDRVLIFFAGHGETMDLPEGGEKGYLIPVEGDSEDLYLTGLPMEELRQIALISRAKHMLYLVDACYGGIAAVGSRGLDSKTTPNYIDKITKDKSRQVITAGGRGEQVIEKPEWGHSAFTLNLKRGLQDSRADYNSDGYITANELGLFLREKVTIDSENQQTPQYGRMTSQEGEFVFINNKTKIVKD